MKDKISEDNRKILENIGLQLKIVRTMRRMSLQTLSDACGYSTSYLSDIENGKRSPGIVCYKKICDATGVDVARIIDIALNNK